MLFNLVMNLIIYGFILWLSKLAEAVVLLTFIQEVPGSNSGRIPTLLTMVFCVFYVSPGKCQDSALN